MSLSEQWINDFRKILKLKIGKNWTVYNSRGNVRLQVGKRPNEETLTTAYKWSEDTWIDAFNRITTIHQILTESKGKIDLKTAYSISSSASSILELDWADSLNSYRELFSYAFFVEYLLSILIKQELLNLLHF